MMEAEQGFFASPEEGDAGARFASEMRRVSVELQEADRAARGLSAAVGGGLRKALDAAVFGTGRFSDVLRGMARDVARGALGAAVGPVQAAVGQGVGGLVDVVSSPMYATGVGLILYGQRYRQSPTKLKSTDHNLFARVWTRMRGWFGDTT